MTNNNIYLPSLEAFEQIGEAFGRGFFKALAQHEEAAPPAEEVDRPEADPQPAADGSEGCAACWCATCSCLRDCDAFTDVSNDHKAPPCSNCRQDGAPLMPKLAAAECGTYQARPCACRACWCGDCMGFEGCIVNKEGFDEGSKPCPCDGCDGAAYALREAPPPCGKYKPPNGES